MNQRQLTTFAERLETAGQALQDAARLLHEGAAERPNGAPRPERENRLAPEERLSSRQLGAIRVASRKAGLSQEELADLVAEVSTNAERAEQLSRREASALLDKLNQSNGYHH